MNLGSPIAKGNTADIYLYEGRVIKVFHDRLHDSEAEYEAFKQKSAYSHGLPVPKIFGVTCVNGKQAIIMEHVKGVTIGDLIQQDEENTESYLALSVDIQIDMHSKTTVALESMQDILNRKLQAANALSDTYKASLLARLAGLPMEQRLCHGDYHVFNLIKNESKTVIIDWVDSSSGSPCADAYRSYLLYSQYSPFFAETYLRLYCEKTGLSRDDIFVWAPIIAGARLSENVSSDSVDHLLNIVKQYL